MSKMKSEYYGEGYFERAEGSNYTNYGDDSGWLATAGILSSIVVPGSNVLEVGAAKGYLVLTARNMGLDVIGVDLSEYAVSSAPSEVKDYLQQANATNLPFPDNYFDCVMSMEMMEHVYEDEVSTVLSEMERVSKPGALMLHRICLKSEDNYAHQDDDHTHVTVESRDWWEEIFSVRGWSVCVEHQASFDSAFKGRDWHGRYFVWRTGTKES